MVFIIDVIHVKYRHAFVKQRLGELGNKIFISGERVLMPRFKKEVCIYEVKKLETFIKSNSELVEQGEIKNITDYHDLNRMGFMLVAVKIQNNYFKGQSVQYLLKRYNAHIPSLNAVPSEHHVEYDELNERIRLTGRNSGPMGFGQWVSIQPKMKKRKDEYLNIVDNTQLIKRKILSRYMEVEETPEIINIPEIPVMISAQGEVVCLEESKNMPVIGVVGARGTGKTLLAHSIIDHMHWKKPNMRIAILNDSLFQTMSWTLGTDHNEKYTNSIKTNSRNMFVLEARKIGEHSMPLPMVFLHPNTDSLTETVYPEENISFKITIPFEQVIQHYDYFLKGKKEWNLGKSAPYFRNIKDDLLKCTNLDEVEEMLDLAVEEEKLNKQSKDKIFSVLIDMFNQKILDVNTKIPAYWEVQRKNHQPVKLNPVLACMEAGVIPSMVTHNLLPQDYFPQYMRYFIDSIFEYQVQVAKHRDEATLLFIDELPDVSSTENRTVAAYSLRRCVTEGRNPFLGTIFALQNWTKVDPLIRNNTTHLFSYQNKANEMKAISKDFDLPTHFSKDIINLPKFRLVGMTNENFVVYSPEGERYLTSDAIKGSPVMPLSFHQAPGAQKKVDERDDDDGLAYDEDEDEGDEYEE